MAKSNTALPKETIEERLRFKILPDDVAYKRIAQELKNLILSKVLLPGTRLPTLPKLSLLWNTNYYTVQTAVSLLVNEGLLECKQRTGTFVAQNTPQIKAVGIYFGASLWNVKHGAFYQALCASLCVHFERLGIAVHIFMDTRMRKQQKLPWKPLITAIERKEINAVVSTMTTTDQDQWLDKLPVPISMIGSGSHNYVDFGVDNFLRSSLERLKARKCRSVALIGASQLKDCDSFVELAEEMGMKSRKEWVCIRGIWPEEFEDFGYDSFNQIWSGATKPDGLIVNPDSIALGVIMAILQQGIRVPHDLKVFFHCNEEIYIHCPFPADWQVVSIAKVVDGIWKSLRAQIEGRTPRKVKINSSIQPASADMPPMLRKWLSGAGRLVQEEPEIY